MNVETLTKTGARDGKATPPKPLPAPNSDFYELAETLPAEELALLKQVRAFMETKVAPIINKYWVEDSFPFELLPAFKELGIGGLGMQGYGCRGGSELFFGLVAMEMARFDSSIATFFGVHNGLAMGSIYLGGSEEQKQKWLPPMARLEKIGCFGLTEPLVGSGASGGLTTTAKREGDTWILNGQKKWIGNSPWCDVSIIWARDVADNQVKGFIVENKTTPGFSVEKIQNKIALKVVQNGLITLKDCRVPEENRLQADNSFRDTARVLRMTRYLVGWDGDRMRRWAPTSTRSSTPRSACSSASRSARSSSCRICWPRCSPTSRPASAWCVRLAQLDAEGKLTRPSCGARQGVLHGQVRETVAWAREVLGGNGIAADYNVARFFADCRSALLLRGHVPDAEPDRRQGDHRLQRLRVNAYGYQSISRTRWHERQGDRAL